MPPTASDPTPEEPPRPLPPRALGELIGAWVSWFGLTRLVLAAVSVVLVGAGAYWLLRAPAPDTVALLPAATTGTPASSLPVASTMAPSSTAPARPIVVHVAGAVRRPGVVTLPPGARVHDAVTAAGGPAPDAEIDAVNLATALSDGQRVYVPAAGELAPHEIAALGAEVPGASASSAPPGPLDLNQATAAELERLPGIGPATAAAIVDDRARNGPFATVDELERVPGIGPAKLAALRDLVTT